MPDNTSHPAAIPSRPARWGWPALLALLVFCALPDLTAPPISPTIVRQTHTFAQTVHFVAGGFSPAALAIDIDGPRPFPIAQEFPLYQALVGALFTVFGPGFLIGKLVSLVAALSGLACLYRLVELEWGEPVARRAGFFYVTCPIALLMNSAFQPDALALAFILGGLFGLRKWQAAPSPGRWLGFLALLLAAGLTKLTVLIPFAPLIFTAVFTPRGKWQWPGAGNVGLALIVFWLPFASWYAYRSHLTDPDFLAGEAGQFFIGDLRRFLHASYYVKPAFILVAMVCCGAGALLAATGLRRLDPRLRLLAAGIPLYFVLLPTAAEQTYYAYPLVPVFALLMGRGLLYFEGMFGPAKARLSRAGAILVWFAGFAVAAPYTLRRDEVTLDAAQAVQAVSKKDDLLFVLNMHDRGGGIGGFNPAIITLAGRRGWNVHFDSAEPEALLQQIEQRRQQGARWAVATWFTPDLEPWFAPMLPATFSRCPRLAGVPVDGSAIAAALVSYYQPVAKGRNFVVLRLSSLTDSPSAAQLDRPDPAVAAQSRPE